MEMLLGFQVGQLLERCEAFPFCFIASIRFFYRWPTFARALILSRFLKVSERRLTPEMVSSDQVFDLKVSDACVGVRV
jgi:hypothetical protein